MKAGCINFLLQSLFPDYLKCFSPAKQLLKPTTNLVGKDRHLILAKPRYNSAIAYMLKKVYPAA